MLEPTVIAAAGAGLVAGAMGGAHCAAMCGGIAGAIPLRPALSLAARQETVPLASPFTRNLAFNAGRIASYTVAGALAGSISSAAFVMHDTMILRQLLFAAANLMLIALGLYLAGIWSVVRRIERIGGALWRHLQPLTRGLLPVATPTRALLLGMLWGWLPCGLVYSVLVTALASGSAQSGALTMLAFGLGTLPNLLAIGLFWENARRWAQSPRVRLAAGLLVAGFGVYGLIKVGYTFYFYGWTGSCHVDA